MLAFIIILFVCGFVGIWIWVEIDTNKEAKEYRKKLDERYKNMSDEEKLYELTNFKFSGACPRTCPSCHAVNYENGIISKWILCSTSTKDVESFDSATTILGSTTVHTKKSKILLKLINGRNVDINIYPKNDLLNNTKGTAIHRNGSFRVINFKKS